MADQRLEVLAGAAVVAIALGFALYAGRNTALTVQAGTYPLTAQFRSVEGVAVGADVKLAGLKVGTITNLVLNPKSLMAKATIAVDSAVQLPSDSAIVISQDGLLGGNYVEIIPGGMPDALAPGDEIEDTQGSVSLINLLMKFVSGSGSKDSGANGSGSGNSGTTGAASGDSGSTGGATTSSGSTSP